MSEETVVRFVKPGRTVKVGGQAHGPGAKVTLTASEALRFEAMGWVTADSPEHEYMGPVHYAGFN